MKQIHLDSSSDASLEQDGISDDITVSALERVQAHPRAEDAKRRREAVLDELAADAQENAMGYPSAPSI